MLLYSKFSVTPQTLTTIYTDIQKVNRENTQGLGSVSAKSFTFFKTQPDKWKTWTVAAFLPET